MIRSFEPGEEWFWSFPEEDFYETGPELAAPIATPWTSRSPVRPAVSRATGGPG